MKWDLSPFESRGVTFFWLYVVCPVIVFSRQIFGFQVTGGDTFNDHFARFLYAVDCLWSGVWPLWNPFTNTGDFFVSGASLSLNPLYLPFVFAAKFVSPLLVFEASVIAAILLGIAGLRRVLDDLEIQSGAEQAVAGTVFAVTIAGPHLGRISILFSLAAFFWALHSVFSFARMKASTLQILFLGVFCALVAGMGSASMNLCVGLLVCGAGLGALLGRSEVGAGTVLARMLVFLFSFLLVSAGLLWPLFERASDFDFVGTSAPVSVSSVAAFASIGDAISALFDVNLKRPRVPSWAWGAGVGILSFLLISIPRHPDRLIHFLFRNLLWICGAAFFTIVSLGANGWAGRSLLDSISLLDGDLFPMVSLVLAQLCVLMIVIDLFKEIDKENAWFERGFRAFYCLLIAGLGFYWGHSLLWLLVGLLSFWIDSIRFKELDLNRKRLKILFVVFAGTLVSKAIIGQRLHKVRQLGDLIQPVSERKTEPVYEGNRRTAITMVSGESRQADFDDLGWVLQKKPFVEESAALANPFFRRIKQTKALEEIISVTDKVLFAERPAPAGESTDDAVLDSMAVRFDEALASGATLVHRPLEIKAEPELKSMIYKVRLEPNTLITEVQANKPALVVNMTKAFPGWVVRVDGVASSLVATNYLFSGVLIPEGRHTVEFVFQPRFRALSLIPYVAFAALVFSGLARIAESLRRRTGL